LKQRLKHSYPRILYRNNSPVNKYKQKFIISTMNFSPNHKTLEYIYAICENKLICSSEFKSAEMKYLTMQLQKKMISEYTINGEVFEFDRNVILYLRVLRDIISLEAPYSRKTTAIYKEIAYILNTIQCSFNSIKREHNEVFIMDPTEFFISLLKIKRRDSPIFSVYINLAKEYLNQLEYMAFAIINRIDELDFDLRSYSDEFFKEFLKLDFQIPDSPNAPN